MRPLFVTLALLCSFYFVQGQNNYQKALEAINNKNIPQAEEFLLKTTKNSQYKDKAKVLLALLNSYSGDSEKGATYFKEYLDEATNPSPVIMSLINHDFIFGQYYGKLPHQLALLSALENNKTKNRAIEPSLDYLLAKHYKTSNDQKLSDAYFSKLNQLKNWQIVGPFSNKMNSGYNKDFGVLEGATLEDRFVSTFGAEIKWNTPKTKINEAFVNKKNYINDNMSILYAQTFIWSDSEQEYVLSFGYTGSFKVWLNDAQVYAREEELNTSIGYHNYTVKLNKGYNRLLVQLGQYEFTESQFNIRLLDKNGSLAAINSDADYHQYAKNTSISTGKEIENSLLKALQKDESEAEEYDFLPSLLLASHYKDVWMKDEAQEIFTNLLAKHPTNYLVLLEAIKFYQGIGDESERSRIFEELKLHYPKCFDVISWEVQDGFSKQDKARVKANLNLWKEDKRPELASKILKMYEFIIDENLDAAIEIMDEISKEMSIVDELTLANYNLKVTVKGQKLEGIKYLEELLTKQFSQPVTRTLANAYVQLGENEKAIELLKSYLDKLESPIEFQQKLINIYTKLSKYDEAIDLAKTIIENRPTDYGTLSDLGYLHRQKKDLAQSEFYYKEVLKYYPFDFSINEKIRELKEQKSIDELLGRVDINAEIKDYEANFISDLKKPYNIVKYKSTAFVFNSLATAYNFVSIYKVMDEEGIEQLQLFNLAGDEVYASTINETFTVKSNGQKIEGERNGSEVVFKNLEVGDYIYFNYTLRQTSGEKHHLFFNDNFEFNSYYPDFKREYTIYAEPEVVLKDTIVNGVIKCQKSQGDGFNKFTWKVMNPAPLKEEPFSPQYADIATVVHVSNGTSWNQIANWYQGLTETQIKSDVTIKKLVKEIIGEKQLNDEQKAKRIYDFVCKNIQYSSIDFRQSGLIPQKASNVYKSRLGDCKDVSALFTSIAREAGLDAEMVLINTSDNGEKEMIWPSIDFNHCIVKLNIKNESKYLELTNSFLPFGYLNNYHQGSAILDIPYKSEASDSKLTNLIVKNSKPTLIVKISNVELNNEGEVRISTKDQRTGTEAANVARNYLNSDDKDRKLSLNNELDNFFEADISVDSVWFQTLEMLKDSSEMNFKLFIKNGLNKLGSFKSMKIPFTDVLVSNYLLQDSPRKYNFDFVNYEAVDKYDQSIVLKLNSEMRIVEIPEDQALDFQGTKYRLSFNKLDDATLEIHRTYEPNRKKMSPTEFEDFKLFVEKIIEAENTFLLFK